MPAPQAAYDDVMDNYMEFDEVYIYLFIYLLNVNNMLILG